MVDIFTITQTSNKLTNYLSRERHNVVKLGTNTKVPTSLFETKVGNYNELVDVLNPLFKELLGSIKEDELLFERIYLDDDLNVIRNEELDALYNKKLLEADDVKKEVPRYRLPKYDVNTGEILERGEDEPDELDNVPESQSGNVYIVNDGDIVTAEQWELDGYDTYKSWLIDKEKEKYPNMNEVMSRKRMGDALNTYEDTAEREVSTYDPESDEPVDVIPKRFSDDYDSDDTSYTRRTADNQPLDNNPHQLVDVKTAVEIDRDSKESNFEIEVETESSITDITHFDVSSDEMDKQYINRKPERDIEDNESERHDKVSVEDSKDASKGYDSEDDVSSVENINKHLESVESIDKNDVPEKIVEFDEYISFDSNRDIPDDDLKEEHSVRQEEDNEDE